MAFTPLQSFYLSFPLFYLHFTQIPTYYYPHSLQPHSSSRIPTWISRISHIATRILTFPPWFPTFLSFPPWFPTFPPPFPMLPPFQPLFPHIPLIPFPDSLFSLLQMVTFCYWHSFIYWFQKIEFIKWIVNATIVNSNIYRQEYCFVKKAFLKNICSLKQRVAAQNIQNLRNTS